MLLINLDASEVYVPYVTSAQEPFGFGLLASEPRLKPVHLESCGRRSFACHINIPGVWAPPVRLQAFDVRVSCLNFFQLLSLLPLMLGMQGRLCKGGLILPIRLDYLEGEKERLAIESAFGQVVKLQPENSTGL